MQNNDSSNKHDAGHQNVVGGPSNHERNVILQLNTVDRSIGEVGGRRTSGLGYDLSGSGSHWILVK